MALANGVILGTGREAGRLFVTSHLPKLSRKLRVLRPEPGSPVLVRTSHGATDLWEVVRDPGRASTPARPRIRQPRPRGRS